jgi:hypothetical protein
MRWLSSSTANETASNQVKLDELSGSISLLKELIPIIYTELGTISNCQSTTGSTADAPRAANERSTTSCDTSKQVAKQTQECNTYAIGVWKRISQKLDGKDPDPNRSLDVAEQVPVVASFLKWHLFLEFLEINYFFFRLNFA